MAQTNIETAIAKYNTKMHNTYAWYCEDALNAETIACNFASHIAEDAQFGATQIYDLCESMPRAIKKEVIKACVRILQKRMLENGINQYCFNITQVIQYCNE